MITIPILAMDGGGTNCRAVLCNTHGTILSFAKGGACNFHNIGLKKTKETLRAVIKQLIQPYQEHLYIQKGVIGLAGIDTTNALDMMFNLFKDIFTELDVTVGEIILNNDGWVTMMGTLGKKAGLLVISGTGSIVYGKNRKKQIARVGGWGHLLGDEGSGYFIGQTALRHCVRALDGREPHSAVTDVVLRHLHLSDLESLVTWTYSSDYSIDKVAALAKEVFALAAQGEAVAEYILDQAGQDLAEACDTAIQKLELDADPFEIVVAGGILQNEAYVLNKMLDALLPNHQRFTIRQLQNEPIHCAVLYGLYALDRYSLSLEIELSKNLDRLIAKEG
ncbi:N-acetylmuramic acid/N-acetylglucosamine kinase [Pullulanibacillus camelliae]|uniref:N-acetylmuramic acid/N-acetylglucosamine kinase n=2 Tax=Pullulanibacillus camelliae TaxID=1707096 RepID=A0A8J2VMA8_9BACL|nr:N-acetylmuramic acid/N-acetylglucosamine kinase [Pullulanibacillus camelliae]